MRTLLAIVLTLNSFIAVAEAQEYGLASVYSATFQGKRTASGEYFNHNDYTAAHQKFPFGSWVKVTRIDNGKWVVVRINDRGPYVSQRITDLSKAAALRLGISKDKEEIRVKLELVDNPGHEIGQSKQKSRATDSPTPDNQPHSTPSSEKAELNSKSVDQQAVLKEYKYVPKSGLKSAAVQKKNLK